MTAPLAQPRTDPAHPADAQVESAVSARSLVKSVHDRRILSGLTFTVARGSLTGLLGSNGAGKSTLLRVLATLTPPTQGSLTILGRTAPRDGAAIRARLGLIGHQLMLYRDLSPLENLEFFGRLHAVPDVRSRAMELLEQMNLAHRANDPVKTLSRGMAQRVAIARALVHSPELLLADEPFTGLDASASRALEGALTGFLRSGRTIILVNHDIAQTLRLTERILVLRRGTLVMDASTGGLTPQSVLDEFDPSP